MKPLAALAIAFFGFGCSSAVTSSSATSSDPSITAASRSLLGTLHTRDREVLLYASPTGMKVTVKAANGALLADRVDVDALRALDPHVYEICRSGVANGATYLDATLDTRMRRSESRDEPAPATPRFRP
ncbi:MAG TPA: hypothetical protein VK550_23895 [Polyangiaceae bacterium]|jgi:hypothetical protein|nr:hypothetical protein [Polyangiaceae bacterium]